MFNIKLLFFISSFLLIDNKICHAHLEYGLPFLGAMLGALCTKKISSKKNQDQEKIKIHNKTKKKNLKRIPLKNLIQNTTIGALTGTAMLLLYKYQNRSSHAASTTRIFCLNPSLEKSKTSIQITHDPTKNTYTWPNMSMQELVSEENKNSFFDFLMLSTKQNFKQFVLTIKNSGSNVIMKFDRKKNEPCAQQHSATCPYCGKINGTETTTARVAYNANALSFLSINPHNVPKCLIIPKAIILRMSKVTQDNQEDITSMIDLIRDIITTYPKYSNFKLEMHNGSAGSQVVHHLHWHFTVPSIKIDKTVEKNQEAFKKMAKYKDPAK